MVKKAPTELVRKVFTIELYMSSPKEEKKIWRINIKSLFGQVDGWEIEQFSGKKGGKKERKKCNDFFTFDWVFKLKPKFRIIWVVEKLPIEI